MVSLLLTLNLLWAVQGLLIREETTRQENPPQRPRVQETSKKSHSKQKDSSHKRTLQTPALQASRVSSYTFKELNFLGDDLVLRGTAPAYDLYIPVYSHLEGLKLTLKISTPEYLREDSTLLLLVDDVPYQSFKVAGGQGGSWSWCSGLRETDPL
ncbi:MAG: hypothetical protein NZ560_04980 [Aquificaceae bacterium]|nr:hypothetical protein [Aquificaceae bacterium]